MGGYAAYVWPAFGVALAVLVGLLVASLRSLRANQAALSALGPASGVHRRASGDGGADEA